MTLGDLPAGARVSFDIASFGIAAGTLAQILPHLAAILTIVWTLIRIWETDTVQRVVRRGTDEEQRRG